jgi:hypothetical protein
MFATDDVLKYDVDFTGYDHVSQVVLCTHNFRS